MSHQRLALTGLCVSVVAAGVLFATTATEPGDGEPRRAGAHSASGQPGAGPVPGPRASDGKAPAKKREGREKRKKTGFGAFVGSGPEGVRRIAKLETWLGGREPDVAHTYLPGDLWSNIEGRPEFLRPWAEWTTAKKGRLLVLNVPMLARNEAGVPDHVVDRLLRAGAAGRFDHHFRVLAQRLVQLGVPDTVLVPGWEMNGTTYTHRCEPNPEAWKAYWRRIVTAMRAVPGADFRFDFTAARGKDAIGWTECYPGDDFVDIIGMDSYDQPPGDTFEEHVNQPFGLRDHVEFAEAHGKRVSYPEWGLFREGDNPQYVRAMLEWIRKQNPVYHTITDYCPHGVWRCDGNPRSSAVFRTLMSDPPGDGHSPEPEPEPEWPEYWREQWWPLPKPEAPSRGEPPWRMKPFDFCLDLGDWIEEHLGRSPVCYRYDGEWTESAPKD